MGSESKLRLRTGQVSCAAESRDFKLPLLCRFHRTSGYFRREAWLLKWTLRDFVRWAGKETPGLLLQPRGVRGRVSRSISVGSAIPRVAPAIRLRPETPSAAVGCVSGPAIQFKLSFKWILEKMYTVYRLKAFASSQRTGRQGGREGER